MTRAKLLWPLAAASGLIAISVGAGSATLVARATGFALAVASLVVLTGWSGQLNLHIAAIGLGWGAYATAGLAVHGVPTLLAIVLAPVIVVPAALLVGAVAVRFRGLELAIATLAAGLAFEQMAFQELGRWLGHSTHGTAFESSLLAIARPGGFSGDRAYAILALVVAAVWLIIAAAVGRGRSGRILRVVRDREVVAEARGVPVFAWRLGAFTLSIVIAAAGGALLAGQSGAVTPGSFGFTLSLQLLAIATLAGLRRLDAALIGAAVLVLTQEAGGVKVLSWLSGERADLIFGAGLIFALAMRSRPRAAARAHTGTTSAPAPKPAPVGPPSAFAPTVLRVDDVGVSFGATRVLDGVTVRVGRAEVVGLVGGNGAGKTTLFDCITGLVTPGKGRVFFEGIDITRIAAHRRAQLGLARTFQGIEVFESLTVLEGVMVAAGLRARNHHDEALRARAHAALEEVGIDGVASDAPSSLPFATLRLAEIATALVVDPSLVLLDEPLAGLDAGERDSVLAAIARLRTQGRSVLIVEHDRASVEIIADRIYELYEGRALERPRAQRAPVTRLKRTRKKGVAVAARA